MPRRAPSNRAPHGQGAGLARSQMFEIPGCHGATHHSFFDGKGTGGKPSRVESNPHLEILYSQGNQTADHMIERVTHRLLPYGPVVVVTNDHAERETILSMGGEVQSCEAFMEEMRQCSEVASPILPAI